MAPKQHGDLDMKKLKNAIGPHTKNTGRYGPHPNIHF